MNDKKRTDEEPPVCAQKTDVLIIGNGLAGIGAAVALSRQGYDITLIGAHERHPPDFRAEKIGDAQMELFKRIGLDDAVRTQMTPFDGVWVHRFGNIVERSTKREYGSDYSDLINALRRALPEAVHCIVGRVSDVHVTADEQHVALSDGRRFRARLLIVATGLGDTVRKKLGIEREILSPAHSLCCGFDLTRGRKDFPFPSLVWSGEKFNDRVSYLTLFPIGDKVRANFFLYRTFAEEWTRQFREHPEQGMRDVMPGLEKMFGRIAVTGSIVTRPIDLIRTRSYEKDGVVLIGDAYCVVCPITGTGIDKALTDVDRLCNVYIPRWFKTPRLSVDKIKEFYADPIKKKRDETAMKMSLDSRSIKTDRGLYWKLRRLRSNTFGRARYVLRGAARAIWPSKM